MKFSDHVPQFYIRETELPVGSMESVGGESARQTGEQADRELVEQLAESLVEQIIAEAVCKCRRGSFGGDCLVDGGEI